MTYAKSAFTLVEMLVVMAIIGILTALLFPVFSAARHKAKSSYCINNLKQIGTAISLYASDYDDHIPYALDTFTKYTLQTEEEPLHTLMGVLPTYNQTLLSYGASKGVFRCPGDTRTEGQLPHPAPGSWNGSSYNYRDDLALRGRALSGFPLPSNNLIVYEERFNHGGGNYHDAFVNSLFADFHVKSLLWENTFPLVDADP